MKIAVIGAGGVGGFFGAKLAAAGCDVTFVARGNHLRAMREHGLRIRSTRGAAGAGGDDLHLRDVRAVEDVSQIPQADLIMIAVKLWDTEALAPTLRRLVDGGAAVVSFQNGVHKDEILRRHLPAEAIFGGVSYIASVIAEPGIVEYKGAMQRLVFGEFDRSQSPRVKAFHAACVKAGFQADISEDITRAIWEKFVFLVGLSGTTSSMRQPIGPIRANAQTRAFLHDVMREVVAVGRAKGVALSESFADDRLAFADTLPPDMTSSMHHDLQRGNRLEVPWLSGGVAAYGRELGVPTPCNRAIADVLALYAEGKRG